MLVTAASSRTSRPRVAATLDPVRILVVTAVAAESDAVTAALPTSADGSSVDVVTGGVGPAAAAATTAAALALAVADGAPYDAVVCAGIAGATGTLPLGTTVVATCAVAADLGAESNSGFVDLAALGFGRVEWPVGAGVLAAARAALPDAAAGPVLTVSTATGTATRAAALRHRHPDAVAEAMEGAGVATAADHAGVPFLELRTVSNTVGPRDRDAWDVPAALRALGPAVAAVVAALVAPAGAR